MPSRATNAVGIHRMLILGCVCVLGACRTTPEAAIARQPETLASPSGTWSFNDSRNRLFNVVLRPDGGAISSWWFGASAASGERGTWRRHGTAIDIVWTDGWEDELRAGRDGVTRRSWSPGASRASRPASFGSAVRVGPDEARFIGVFRCYDSSTDRDYMVALNAAGLAARTDHGTGLGLWTSDGDSATISWPDSARQEIAWRDGVYLERSWPDGPGGSFFGPFVIRTVDGLPYGGEAGK